MGTNKIVMTDTDDNLLFRVSISNNGELQYETYDSVGELYKTPISLTPSSG